MDEPHKRFMGAAGHALSVALLMELIAKRVLTVADAQSICDVARAQLEDTMGDEAAALMDDLTASLNNLRGLP